MTLYTRFFFSLLLSLPFTVYAQQGQIYIHDTAIKVYDADGNLQTLAGCGGFNNPQFSMGDLNNDGLPDLVVFENNHGVRTFINTGVAGHPVYTYNPKYERNFPPCFDYMILADYNCDNVPDLFEQGLTGFRVFKGWYNFANELCFTFYEDLFYSNDTHTNGYPGNAYNNPGDIPAIVDIDNDGDLDFVSYDVLGGTLNFYKNMRVEKGMPCDSIDIELVDRCWGKVYQAYWRTHNLHYDCDESGLTFKMAPKKTHQGNTPCLFDYDMDGDYDYLDGSISFNEMTFLLNGKEQNGGVLDSMVAQDTVWQTNGKSIELPVWPAAFNVDIDQDGKKDLLIAPNAQGTSENYKCVWMYKNNSTPNNAQWAFQSDTFLIDKMIDLGTDAYPAFFDFNKDGKPDLFIGSDGYYQPDGTLQSRISYYENTSTVGHPSYKLMAKDFLGTSGQGFAGENPAFGDIDNDGITDMLVGHTDGTVSFYKNMAAAENMPPVWQLAQLALTDDGGNTILAQGGSSSPFIYDLDKDSKPDLLLGEMYGYVAYYRNTGSTPGQVSLQLVNQQVGNVRADGKQFLGNYSTVFVGKIDSSNNDYMLLGSNSGNIYRFDSFQTGNVTINYPMIDSDYSFIDSTYLTYNHPGTAFGIYSNFRSAPAVADVDGSGRYIMVVGDVFGGVKFYTMGIAPSSVAPVSKGNYNVSVYPNPVKEQVKISWDKGMGQQDVQVNIYNIEGQSLIKKTVSASELTLSVADFPPGLYICTVRAGGNIVYKRFTVLE